MAEARIAERAVGAILQIGAWPEMSEAEQHAVAAQLEARRLAAARNDSAKSSA